MPNRSHSALAVFGALLLAGCSTAPDGGVICTAVFAYGVVVEIRDSVSGAPLAAGARGAVHDGAYVDSLRPAEAVSSDTTSLYSREAAGERAGTYAIEVVRSGYRTWTKSGVTVTRDACHVRPQRVRAALVPNG
ncbi:hypothetical protein tb265_06460 [Gemmatimonadetes bacterium T265]|nr:hypothetical protein tb265_06460 [Gemmatimonadetes bacterium T265]